MSQILVLIDDDYLLDGQYLARFLVQGLVDTTIRSVESMSMVKKQNCLNIVELNDITLLPACI